MLLRHTSAIIGSARETAQARCGRAGVAAAAVPWRHGYSHIYTFCIGPVGVEVGQRRLVADLLECLGGLVVHLKDAARSPPAGAVVAVGHVEVGASTARRSSARVVGNGALEEDWGRQLGGIGEVMGRRGGREGSLGSSARELLGFLPRIRELVVAARSRGQAPAARLTRANLAAAGKGGRQGEARGETRGATGWTVSFGADRRCKPSFGRRQSRDRRAASTGHRCRRTARTEDANFLTQVKCPASPQTGATCCRSATDAGVAWPQPSRDRPEVATWFDGSSTLARS